MEMNVTFPGGKAVTAQLGNHAIKTDQPTAAGGSGEHPSPFGLFMGSIATCAGFFALRFCQERDIDTTGMDLTVSFDRDPETMMVSTVKTRINLPEGFPDKYKKAIVRTVEQCTVKKHLQNPPAFEMEVA